MKTFGKPGEKGGFSLVELLVTMGIIGVLAALLLPATQRAMVQGKRVKCTAQLKDLGVAFHGFAHDHQSLFPAHVAVVDGGAREYAAQEFLSGADFSISPRQFQPLASELSTPRALACPADLRNSAPTFPALTASNLSYLVGLNAEYQAPGSVLAVDRNLALANLKPTVASADGEVVRVAGWSHELHQTRGNALFADAHVETRTTIEFKRPAPQVAARPGSWLNPFTLPARSIYAASAPTFGGPYYPQNYPNNPASAGPSGHPAAAPSYGLFTMLQQPQAAPTPMWRPTGRQPVVPARPAATASVPAKVAEPLLGEPPVESGSTKQAVVASTSSGINYWWLILLLVAALGLRQMLLRTVTGKKGKTVGQALPSGRWSRRVQRR